MPTLTTRLGTYGKGSALSHAEMDANWKRPVIAVTSTPVTLTEAHNRNIIECGTGSGTLALTAAATLAAIDTEDWFVDIVNTTSSSITIDPDGSETIGGSATYTLPANGSVRVFLDSAKTAFLTSSLSIAVSSDEGKFLRAGASAPEYSTPYYAVTAYISADFEITSTGSYFTVDWGNNSFTSTAALHDATGAPSLFVAPSWATKMRVTGQLLFATNATGLRGWVLRTSAGADLTPSPNILVNNNGAAVSTTVPISTGIIPCTGGSSYRIEAYQSSGAALNLTGVGSKNYVTFEFFP